MADLSDADSKRMYSWWWDSHISPKNSKWLQENLSDMDCKVKQMIKLLEEDADSFARRAEMYYKKRPELMKLVEEFYRAYRALAGRYDHATGVIRHAHKTIAEVFPNQVPLMFGDESPAGASTNEADPRTPEMPPPIRAPVDPDVLHKDALGFSSSHMHSAKRNTGGLKQLSDLCGSETGRARKGLNFNDGDEKGRNGHSDESNDLKAQILSESERAKKAEAEILALKDALSKVQAEKEATITQYKLNSERLSNLESEISCAQEDSRVLNERATKAEAEVQALKDALNKLEFEKESSLLQYQQSLQRIDDLNASISQAKKDAGEINERANKAEAETQILKQSLARAETEKETALVQYRQCLETISNLEERLLKAEEDARIINERAEKAEAEIEKLKQTISKLVEDRETSELRYQQCLETIADLKLKLFNAQEETDRLSREVEEGVAKLKIVEEKCVVLERSNQTLHSELDTLFEKLGNQNQELMEKQSELGRLWTCVQEERSRFLEAETAFQTLQQLHSQSQEEIKALDLELQIRSQILKDMETRNNDLQEEVQKVKDENKGLSELNLSSAASIKSLQEEVLSLRETIHKLEAEIELRVDQRNALQQEIYCLKEELRQIGKKHQSILEQVELVGFHPDCFGSSVKELQDENSKLKELNERENNKKMELLEKLEMMEKLAQKNLLLENSISDLNSELEAIRGKLQKLEEACQSLSEEKSGLVAEKDMLTSRLHTATENSEKLCEKNKLLENSLVDANAELRDHRLKLKSLEDSCRLLSNEKSNLITEREILISQMDVTRKALEDMEKGQAQLELKVSALQMERESSLQKIEELGLSLGAKDREYVSFVQLTEAQLGYMESKIHHLQDEYQLELDRGVDAQMEIFVLQKCLQDILEKNSCLIVENQNIKDASKMSEKLISELEQENSGYRVQIDSLIGRIKVLKLGVHQVLKRLEITPDIESGDENSQDQKNMNGILTKLDEMQNIILRIQNENQQSAIENFNLITLLQQLKSEADGISKEKSILEEELEFQHQQLSSSQDEMKKLICVNEELISKVKQGLNIEEALKKEVEDLHRQVLDLQGAYSVLQEENYKNLDDKISLTKSTVHLEEEKCELEEYISLLLSENIYQSSLILLLEDVIFAKFSETKKLSEDLSRLNSIKDKLEEKVRKIEDKLKYSETENLELKGLLEISEGALVSIRSACDQLGHEIASGKDELCQKEKELVEAKLLILVFENEKAELSKMVENLECKYKETQSIQEDQEKQILTLGEDYDEQVKETERVNEMNSKLKARLQNLIEELEETKMEKEKLNNDLLKEREDAELWESQAGIFFGQMQVAAVHEALLEGMAQRLAEACENLESRNASKDVEIERLNERLSSLEDSNKGQQTRLVKYAQAAVLLDESIKSLENHIAIHREAEDELIKGSASVADKDVEYYPEGEDRFSEFHDMHLRLKAIQESMIENEKLVILETTNTYSKLEAAMKKIQELKSGSRRSKRKQINEISQEETETEVITKDIMLDQVSDCSSYGKSMRGTVVTDDQKIELWEVNDLKLQKHDKEKGKSLSEESFVVDKLEISDRFTDPNQEVHKKKVLERLNSDLQKLTNLRITVEDMKNKVEIDNNGKKGKGDEYETIKGQLEEAKEEIEKLFNVNRKLVTKVNNGFSDETESNRRRKIWEHARKGSEKVGRLQFEIQRIHLLLMKLEGEKGKSKSRVLLRDYMYGGIRKKKTMKATKNKFGFCACVQPHSP